MTNRAVVELRRIVGADKARIYNMRDRDTARSLTSRDDVLMNIVRKYGREFVRPRSNRKRKPCRTARAGICVTTDTEARSKKIAAMTLDARRVAREIGDVRISAGGYPVRRRIFVAVITLKLLMVRRRVRELIAASLCIDDKAVRKKDRQEQR